MLRTLLATFLLAWPLAVRADEPCASEKKGCDDAQARIEYLDNTRPLNADQAMTLSQWKDEARRNHHQACSTYRACERAQRHAARQQQQQQQQQEPQQQPDPAPEVQSDPPPAPPVAPQPPSPPSPPKALSEGELGEAVQGAKNRFAVCVQENLARAPQGTYALQFTVEPSGAVDGFSASGPGLDNKDVAACFERVAGRLQLRPPPAPQKARQTLSY